MADVLVDTDQFVLHLRGEQRLRVAGHRVRYSTMTRGELCAGTSAIEVVRTLLAPFDEIPVDAAIAERAGRLRFEVGLRPVDAVIAATALEHGWSLATGQRQRYVGVRGLRLRTLR